MNDGFVLPIATRWNRLWSSPSLWSNE